MKAVLSVLPLSVVLLAACGQAPAPADTAATPAVATAAPEVQRPARTYRIEDFVESTSIGGASSRFR